MKKYGYFFMGVFLNVLFIWSVCLNLVQSGPVSDEELTVVSGKIESIALTSIDKRHLNIKVNSVVYNLYKMNRYDKVDFDNICSQLEIGDDIELMYVVHCKYIFKYNVIVALNVEGAQYQTINDYNNFHSDSKIASIVEILIYVFVELFIILLLLFYLWALKEKKSRKRKKRRQIKGKTKQGK